MSAINTQMPQMVEIRKHPSFYPNSKIENKCFRDKMLACCVAKVYIVYHTTGIYTQKMVQKICMRKLYNRVAMVKTKKDWYGAMHKFYITKHFLEHLLDL